eukprot:945803-Pyramimonas_sp.AAC.1
MRGWRSLEFGSVRLGWWMPAQGTARLSCGLWVGCWMRPMGGVWPAIRVALEIARAFGWEPFKPAYGSRVGSGAES